MSYYTPNNVEDLEKIKNIIKQRKDIKKLRLNTKIQKETQNYDLAEQYAPITKLQEKQTEVIKKGQDDQTKAIQNHTETKKALTAPLIKDESTPSVGDDEVQFTKSIDNGITAVLSSLVYHDTYRNFFFTKEDFNNYTVNERPFRIIDNTINFGGLEYQITPLFLEIFMKGNKADFTKLSDEEKEALVAFIDYAGGLGGDVKSNLYQAVKFVENSKYQDIEGNGMSFIFLSSDPNVLVNRLEVLIGESLAGNKNAYREASAILSELVRMSEISNNEYENIMNIFIK